MTKVEKESAEAGRPMISAYDKLRGLAARYLSQEARDHTLQPTALVHEAYLRLSAYSNLHDLDSRAFFCIAASAMRSVLIDHARRRKAQKRGGNARKLPLDAVVASYEERSIDLQALDEALSKLDSYDEHLARLIEFRFFCGLTVEETAAVLGVSPRTVSRNWRIAKMWLSEELKERVSGDGRPMATG